MAASASRPWVLITGCSTGIGRALVPLCREAGWGVVATARRPESLADLLPGEDLRVLALDVTDPASLAGAVAACADLPLRAVVNNAGYGQTGPLELARPEDLRAQFETNVVGLHAVTTAFLPQLRRQPSPRIIQVASMLGRLSIPLAGPYNASKHAVVALAETLRMELGPEIPVILVEPGAIRTEFRQTVMSAWGDLPDRVKGTVYEAVVERYRTQREEYAREHGMEAVDCAALIVRALNAHRPPRRVIIGRDSFWAQVAHRAFPAALFEWAVRRTYGLK